MVRAYFMLIGLQNDILLILLIVMDIYIIDYISMVGPTQVIVAFWPWNKLENMNWKNM